MKQENKVKLLKVLAFPASAAFMLGVGTMAICAEETDPAVQNYNQEEGIETQGVAVKETLDGDLTITVDGKEDTTHESTPEVDTNQKFDITGKLDVSKIEEQMNQNEKEYIEKSGGLLTEETLNNLEVTNTEFEFAASFTFPSDIISITPDVEKEYNTPGFTPTLTVDTASNTAQVKWKLTNEDIKTYGDIKKVVKALKTFTFTFKNLSANSPNVTDGSYGVIYGNVVGYFNSDATLVTPFGSTTENFSYQWTSVQSEDGKDVTTPSGINDILLAIKVNVPTTPSQPETPEQPETPKEEETTPSTEETSTTETKKTSVKTTKTNSVQTGVKTEMAGMISLMGLSLAGLVATKKRKDNE